jgi:predicted amidohydrolase
MHIALAQTPGIIGDITAAFVDLDAQARHAAAGGAALLVLPEMYLSGYNIGAAAAELALRQDQLAPAAAIARAHNIALAFGYPERVGAQVANSAALFGPTGALLLNYRKTHLFGTLDRAMFGLVGDEFPLATLHGYKVALLICYDIEFPEPARRLALAGADLLLVPTAQMAPYDAVPRHLIPARAYENQLYIAYANHTGVHGELHYIGQSSICGPDGAVLASAGAAPAMLFATLDPTRQAEIRARDPLLADRRPDLYATR